MARTSNIGFGFETAAGLRRLIGTLAVALAVLSSDGHAQVDPGLPTDPDPLNRTTSKTFYTYTARTTRNATKLVTAGAIR